MSIAEERSEIIEKRNQNLDTFAEWMSKAGLRAIDYELIEEHREDGTVVWYFQKRIIEGYEDSVENAYDN